MIQSKIAATALLNNNNNNNSNNKTRGCAKCRSSIGKNNGVGGSTTRKLRIQRGDVGAGGGGAAASNACANNNNNVDCMIGRFTKPGALRLIFSLALQLTIAE